MAWSTCPIQTKSRTQKTCLWMSVRSARLRVVSVSESLTPKTGLWMSVGSACLGVVSASEVCGTSSYFRCESLSRCSEFPNPCPSGFHVGVARNQ